MLQAIARALRKFRVSLKRCLYRFDHPPAQVVRFDLAEAMRCENQKTKQDMSQVSHANTNATQRSIATGHKIKKSFNDALAEMGRHAQGRM